MHEMDIDTIDFGAKITPLIQPPSQSLVIIVLQPIIDDFLDIM